MKQQSLRTFRHCKDPCRLYWIPFAVLLLGVLLCSSPAKAGGFCDESGRCTQAPWSFSEVGVATGAFFSGYNYGMGGNLWDPYGFLEVKGRFRPRGHNNFLDRLLLEGSLFGNAPLGQVGASAMGGTVRVGLGWQYVAFTVGAYMRYDFTDEAPFQVWPSLTLKIRPGAFAIALSVLDRPDGAVARLAFEYGSFGIAFSALYGVEAYARFVVAPTWALEVRGYANWILNSFSSGFTLAAIWGKGSTYQFGGGVR